MVFGQIKSDYYIIADPVDYNIANQFQQTMSDAEKRDKLTDAPLRVENPDQVSGDQISHVAKCVYNSENYFLLKDDGGKFIGEKKYGRQTFRNCAVIDDTVTIVRGGPVKIVCQRGRRRYAGRGWTSSGFLNQARGIMYGPR